MSEPTFICSAPELANSAQKIALYSHYAAAVAAFAGGGVMISRTRVQEKVPHILGAIAAFGIGFLALYSQWEFNQYLYSCRETAANAVGARAGFWAVWGTLLLVGLSLLPGFRFKRMGRLALLPLIIFTLGAFIPASIGDVLASVAMTAKAPVEIAVDAAKAADFAVLQKASAIGSALIFGIPALISTIIVIVIYIITQTKKVEKRSMENHQARTGIMALVAACIPAVVYSTGAFLFASGAQGVDKAVLLFNCADIAAVFFLLCATMSLLGTPANFSRPVKTKKEKPLGKKKGGKGEEADTHLHPTVQEAYAQAYAQQLYAQQQAYAQYYAQQQQAAVQQAQTAAQTQQQAQAEPVSAAPASTLTQQENQPQQQAADPVAIAAYQQQQAQYYAQQQAYAAYQQQQQAYQQAYAAQQHYAQGQQQAYAEAYQQQQSGYQHAPASAPRVAKVGSPRQVSGGGVKKIGGVRPIKKVR